MVYYVYMKKIMFKKIHFGFALFVLASLSVIPISILALISFNASTNEARAFATTSFGGKITYTSECQIEDPVYEPSVCHTCLLCTGLLGSACAGVTEIQFKPSPLSKWLYVCPNKAFLYKGGRPRIGAAILGNGLNQFTPIQIGMSR